MTTTNDQIREIQDRDAQARGRVIAAGQKYFTDPDGGMRERSPDQHVAGVVEAAIMELAAVWRESAAWWLASGKRGAKGTAAELTQAAGRLAGFAVGLSTRPVEMPASVDIPTIAETVAYTEDPAMTDDQIDRGTQAERCADGLHPEIALSVRKSGAVKCTACGVEVGAIALPPPPAWGPEPIAQHQFEALVAAEFATLEAERTQHLDPVTAYLTGATDTYDPQETPVQPAAATVQNIVDNPFTSPGAPGANRAPVTPLPFHVLPVIAGQLEPRTELSHSYVETYESCSLKAMLQRASRHALIGPQRPSWSLIGGNAFHSAVEQIERDAAAFPGRVPVSSRGIDANAKQIGHWTEADGRDRVVVEVDGIWQDALDGALREVLEPLAGTAYADQSTWHASNSGKEGYDWWRVEGAMMLHRYLEFHDAQFRAGRTILRLQPLNSVRPEPVLEQEFVASIAADAGSGTSALTTRGFIDAVWLEPNATNSAFPPSLIVTDLKTGSRRPTSTFQLGEYAHGLSTLLPAGLSGAEILGSYWLARKGEYTPRVPLLAKHPADELTYRYRQVALGASLGIATPNVTDMCSACSVRDYCPAQASR